MKSVPKDKLLDKTLDGAYCIGGQNNDDGTPKVYSTYQRNEVAERWQRPDGSIYIKIRHKTKEESEKRRERAAKKLKAAIENGDAVRDRIGRVKWIKH